MAKKLTNNLGLKILALLVSTILWFIAININDPISQQSFSVNVQIENLDKLENSGKYVEVKPGTDTAKVTVFATRSDLKNINEICISKGLADSLGCGDGNYVYATSEDNTVISGRQPSSIN